MIKYYKHFTLIICFYELALQLLRFAEIPSCLYLSVTGSEVPKKDINRFLTSKYFHDSINCSFGSSNLL